MRADRLAREDGCRSRKAPWCDPGTDTGDATVGIFSCSEGSLVYEEYAGEIADDPISVAHLERRAAYEPASLEVRDVLTTARHGY
jgi:hypothetical protein